MKVHPSSAYHILNLPVFVNETAGTYHYINPALYESDELPERFRNACKLMDIHTAGLADGTFILWFVYVSASRWCKAANKAVETAKREYVIVSSINSARPTASSPNGADPRAKRWASLPSFDQMLMDAFDSTVHVADDKVVLTTCPAASRHARTRKMSRLPAERFPYVYVLDTEYQHVDGEQQRPVCLVAHGFNKGRRIQAFFDRPQPCPFRTWATRCSSAKPARRVEDDARAGMAAAEALH